MDWSSENVDEPKANEIRNYESDIQQYTERVTKIRSQHLELMKTITGVEERLEQKKHRLLKILEEKTQPESSAIVPSEAHDRLINIKNDCILLTNYVEDVRRAVTQDETLLTKIAANMKETVKKYHDEYQIAKQKFERIKAINSMTEKLSAVLKTELNPEEESDESYSESI